MKRNKKTRIRRKGRGHRRRSKQKRKNNRWIETKKRKKLELISKEENWEDRLKVET